MVSEAPKRRFAPVPVETTTKSSRGRQDETSRTKASTPRRFAIEPVETSVKRSSQPKDVPNGSDTSKPDVAEKTKPRKFAVEPVETTTRHNVHARNESPKEDDAPEVKKPRKFNIQPIETSSTTVRKDEQSDKPKPRKFAIQPVEETSKSSKDKSGGKLKSRFAPQPVESTQRRRRSQAPARRDSELDETPADIVVPTPAKKPTRKFMVDLIDTSSRSRKNSDELSPVPHKFRTDVVPGHMVTPNGQPLFPAASQMKRLPLPYERRKERHGDSGNIRSHSFLAPDLETIESSESEASETGSALRSTTPSAANDSPLTISEGSTESFKRGMKAREDQEHKFSEFMSGLEAQRAEQKLREQVLAAFPNSDFHEPVEHYVNNDDNDSDQMDFEDRPATWEGHDDDEEDHIPKAWRQATSKIDWELEDMKKHQEQLEKTKAAALLAAAKKAEAGPSPWWNAAAARDFGKAVDAETVAMRDRARPPMLGGELVFPRSQSPEPARFDITQGSHTLRAQMCYLTEQAEAREREPKTTENGLWGGAASPTRHPSGSKGLWAGLCAVSPSRQNSNDSSNAPLPSGLITPAVTERANPFDEQASPRVSSRTLQPPTPPHTRTKMLKIGVPPPAIDTVLNTDEELTALMAAEYPDSFITQVFNYLSLGYPSLARPFDAELAKISGVTVERLRKDDDLAKGMPKGYIRIGDDFEGRGDGRSQELEHNKCARWRALKLYVREWARQEKGMVQVQAVPWGTGARRGSWAW